MYLVIVIPVLQECMFYDFRECCMVICFLYYKHCARYTSFIIFGVSINTILPTWIFIVHTMLYGCNHLITKNSFYLPTYWMSSTRYILMSWQWLNHDTTNERKFAAPYLRNWRVVVPSLQQWRVACLLFNSYILPELMASTEGKSEMVWY